MSEGVDSASHSVVEVLRSAPEPELETVGPLDHLHKIGTLRRWSGMLGKRPGNMASVSGLEE